MINTRRLYFYRLIRYPILLTFQRTAIEAPPSLGAEYFDAYKDFHQGIVSTVGEINKNKAIYIYMYI